MVMASQVELTEQPHTIAIITQTFIIFYSQQLKNQAFLCGGKSAVTVSPLV